jgi:DNA polymerase I-like protein with 3'-5' exonuclease and polymerase domains
VPVLDSVRATAARLTALGLAPPTGPVTAVAEPDAAGVLAAVAPLLSDLAVPKLGADVKAIRVALARRGIAFAGPTFDLSLASYCLNPSRPDHGIHTLAEEFLGQPRDPAAEPSLSRSSPSACVCMRWIGFSATSRCRSPRSSPRWSWRGCCSTCRR